MKHTWLMALLAILALGMPASAGITNHNCDDDGDGAIVMTTQTLNYEGIEEGIKLYTLDVTAAQYDVSANMFGDFTVDDDPRVWITQGVENDTTFAWKDYHLVLGMTQSFTVLATSSPDGWVAPTVSDVTEGTVGHGDAQVTGYMVTVDYLWGGEGTEVAIGDDGSFGIKVQFSGSVAFCTEQTPTPEPGSLALIGMGALALLRRRG
jgi:MYXO-CTERM domain-containing protein